jgi:hypothetical protein
MCSAENNYTQTGEELRTGTQPEKPGQKVMLRERACNVCAVDIGNQGEVDILITKTFRGLGIKSWFSSFLS